MKFLGGLGFEAVHLHELDLDRLPDAEILTKAQHEGNVILTHDLDFGELLAISESRIRIRKLPIER